MGDAAPARAPQTRITRNARAMTHIPVRVTAMSNTQSSVSPAAPIVYIADRDSSSRAELEALMHCRGWQTRSAVSARELLAISCESAPGCLLLELDSPGPDCLDLQLWLNHRA